LPDTSDDTSSYAGTPDLNASAPLAGLLKSVEGNHFRPAVGPFDQDALAGPAQEATAEPGDGVGAPALAVSTGPAAVVGGASAAASWGPAAVSAPVQPTVGPAAQARSTADALRRLTRRVPGASLPEEDDSLRRPTTMSTTRNPLGLSGALSQYLSVTVEGRPEKEHNAQ
jgi:hypothetical protein